MDICRCQSKYTERIKHDLQKTNSRESACAKNNSRPIACTVHSLAKEVNLEA